MGFEGDGASHCRPGLLWDFWPLSDTAPGMAGTPGQGMPVRRVGPQNSPPGAHAVYSCGSRKSEGFSWFIINTQMLGIRFLLPERIQEILCVFVFSSVTLLRRIFSQIFYHRGFPFRFGPHRN